MRCASRKIVFLLCLLIVLLFLVSCKYRPTPEVKEVEEPPAPVLETVQEVQEEVEIVEPVTTPVCEYTSDCEQGLLCINKECKTLASLYKTDCENKCTITDVKVNTSDGEKYSLALGQGSYTAAGALEWKLLKTPEYCQGEEPLVAVNIIKKTTGKVVGEQVLTLYEGDTSDVITHPTIKSVKFTATLGEVSESCS